MTAFLSQAHRDQLNASGISEHVVEARDYRTFTDEADLIAIGFAPYQAKLVPALGIPVWGVDGSVRTVTIRPDAPRMDGKGKIRKYEFPPGAVMAIDVPRDVRTDLGDPTLPLVITEGSKKADAAVSKGMCCIAIPGVYAWRGTNTKGGKTALADWESVALKGREVRIAFDSDIRSNRQVRSGAERLAGFLRSMGANARFILLPPGDDGKKTGLDDFFVGGGTPADIDGLVSDDLPSMIQVAPGSVLIDIGPDFKVMADVAEGALAAGEVYVRGKELVAPMWEEGDDLPAPGAVDPGGWSVAALPLPTLDEILSNVCTWVQHDEKGDRAVPPPPRAVAALFARKRWPKLRSLRGIVNRPVIRPDGSVADASGWDRDTRLLIKIDDTEWPDVEESPTDCDARAALDQLYALVSNYDWVEACDRTAWLSLVLTALGREMVPGPVPAFAVRAPERGAGKSLLADVAAILDGGRPGRRITQGATEEEEEKRLATLGRKASRLVVVDNVTRPWGSDALCSAIDGPGGAEIRLLGTNEDVLVRGILFVATGNNLTVRSDMGRRVLPIDFDPAVERPDERAESSFEIPRLRSYVEVNRPRLVVAALTLWRWWHVQGRPVPGELSALPGWGSFEAWSTSVRAMLYSLGEGDAAEGRKRFRESGDGDLDVHRALLQTWIAELKTGSFTGRQIVDRCAASVTLTDAVSALNPKIFQRDKLDSWSTQSLGIILRRFSGRIVSGLRLVTDKTRAGSQLWMVERANVQEVTPF